MTRALRAWLGCALLATLLGAAVEARAEQGFDAQRFHPAPHRGTGYLEVMSPRTAGKRAYGASLWLDALGDPLVLSAPPSAQHPNGVRRWASVVDRRVDLHLLFAYGLTDWLELGVDVPLVLAQMGDRPPRTELPADDAGVGLGDVRLVPRVELVSQGADDTGFGLGAFLDASLPTGSQRDFRSDGFRVEPGLAAEYAFRPFRMAVNASYVARERSLLGSLEYNDAVLLGAAAEAFFTKGLSVLAEFDWERGIAAAKDNTAHQARDLMFGGRFLLLDRLLFEAGGARGIKPNQGVPEWRVHGGLSWLGRGKRTSDGDADGLSDERDPCAAEPEDRDGFEDADGCPDPDNDGDGVLDARDLCPNAAEDPDGVADTDGCPDLDDDEDGIPDTRDGCPAEREDLDGFGDDDGCLDPDNDGDGRLDAEDGALDDSGFGACRHAAEDLDGVEDEDGCPELDAPAAAVPPMASTPPVSECAQPFREPILFVKGRSTLTHEGRATLRALARSLREAPHISSVRIEGHADDLGDPLFNQSLSLRRSIAVEARLKRHRVKQTLEIVGRGEDQPLEDNESEEGRARNRRVEVVVPCP